MLNESRDCPKGARSADDHSPRSVVKYRGGACGCEIDQVVDEARFEVRLDGRRFCEVTCSPWSVAELAVGRLLVEGALEGRIVEDVEVDEARGVIYVLTVASCSEGSVSALSGNLLGGSCSSPLRPLVLESGEVSRLAMQLEAASGLFQRTGGVHGAALARDGKMLAYFVDMGRHNAVDKLAGWCLLNDIDASDAVMVFSGRVPLEIMEKVAAIGCPVVIACGAPTNQSLDFAEGRGVTVVGFAKGDRFNVYTHPWRIGEVARRLDASVEPADVPRKTSCM